MKPLLTSLKMRQKMILLAVSGIVLTAVVLWSVFYSVMHAVYRRKIISISQEAITQSAKYLNNELTHVLQIAHGGLVRYNVSEMVRLHGEHLHDPLIYAQMQQMLTQFKIQNTLISSAHLVRYGYQISNLNNKAHYDMNRLLEKASEEKMIYWSDEIISLENTGEQIIPLVIPVPYSNNMGGEEYNHNSVLVIDLSFTEIMKTLQGMEKRTYGQMRLLNEKDRPFWDEQLPLSADSYVQTALLDINGWKIESTQEERVLLSEFRVAQVQVAGGFLLIVLCFVVIASIISKSITKPLLQLTKITEKLQVKDYSEQIVVRGNDEIAQLEQALECLRQQLIAYETIVEQDKRIIRQEEKEKRKIEMSLLQSQINPHFLYNTMDAMYWYSVDNNNQKVGDLILQLSSFFRLSLSKGEEFVTVQHELEHVKTYLQIQKNIFGGKFSYIVHADPAVLQFTVMKILLQPLVENSILHGFSDMEAGGEIEVNVFEKDACLVMQVLDNGCGFSQPTPKGFALSNIRRRLLYGYGDKAELTTERTFIGMTKVEIKISKEVLEQ